MRVELTGDIRDRGLEIRGQRDQRSVGADASGELLKSLTGNHQALLTVTAVTLGDGVADTRRMPVRGECPFDGDEGTA